MWILGDSIPFDANAAQQEFGMFGEYPGSGCCCSQLVGVGRKGRKPMSSQTIALRTLVRTGDALTRDMNRSRT